MLTLNLSPIVKLTDPKFERLALLNRDLRLELTATGELMIMPPMGGETGNRNFEIYIDLGIWNRQYRLGKAFDSSTGFKLPNGATRSPDVSWLENSRWESLSKEQRKKFLPLCPDFAIELLSENDETMETDAKMQEYLANGLKLGWLIDPRTKQVIIYRPDREVEILIAPTELSGEDILAEFILNLEQIWQG
jgi:Uma2 family endonuclease